MYHLERRYQPSSSDRTYGWRCSIDEASSRYFSQSGLSALEIRKKLQLDAYLMDGRLMILSLPTWLFDECYTG